MPYLQAAPETPTVSLSPDAEIPVLQNREPAVPDYSDRDYTFCHQPKAFRHHQIRVQLSHEGLPLLGDRKYNPSGEKGTSLGLCSSCLEFKHPRTGKMMKFETEPQGNAFLDFVKKV